MRNSQDALDVVLGVIVGFGCLIGIGLLAVTILALMVIQAQAHDIYSGALSKSGMLCCGGDPIKGDCEPLEEDQIRMRADGDAMMFSKRYRAWVQVSKDMIQYQDIPADNLKHAGHFCGRPKQSWDLTNPAQPDPSYQTYCAFLTPGGA